MVPPELIVEFVFDYVVGQIFQPIVTGTKETFAAVHVHNLLVAHIAKRCILVVLHNSSHCIDVLDVSRIVFSLPKAIKIFCVFWNLLDLVCGFYVRVVECILVGV